MLLWLSLALALSATNRQENCFRVLFLTLVVNRRFQISRWSRLPTLHYTRHNSSGQCQNLRTAFCWSQNCRVSWALIFTEALDKKCNYNIHTLSRLRLTLDKFSIKVTLKITQKNKSYLCFASQPVEKK